MATAKANHLPDLASYVVRPALGEGGVDSPDSSCVLPPQSLSAETLRTIEDYTVRLAKALRVVGLMNVQYAIQNGVVYVLEVNPRASRTVPYVSKATGVPLPNIA